MGFTPVNAPLATGNGGIGSAGLNQVRPRKPARYAVLSEVGPPLKPPPEGPIQDPEAVLAGATDASAPEKKKTRPTHRFKVPLYSELQKKPVPTVGSRTHLANVRPAPEIQATISNLANFAAFVSTIEQIGKAHGIVKVIFPLDYFSKYSPIDWNSIPFQAHRQAINIPPETDTEISAKFVTTLKHFHLHQPKPQEVPPLLFCGRNVDLYDFHFAVISRGGFITVGRTQTWPFVWDEINVGGNYPALLHQRLKLYYRRYIAPFDEFLRGNEVPLQELQGPLLYGLNDKTPAFTLPFNITVSKVTPSVWDTVLSRQKSSGTLLRGLLSHPTRHGQGSTAIELNEQTFWNVMKAETAIVYKALMAQDPRTLPILMQQDGPSSDDRTLLLHDITYSQWSLFSYISEDIKDDAPTAEVGSVFSSTPWQSTKHTTKISLMHDGAPRTWYCVPGDFREQAEASLDSNTMDPQRMGSHVPVFATDQNRGELVFIFNDALFMNFDHGFNVVESSHFWPTWKGLSSLPQEVICLERVLYNIARSNPPQELTNSVREVVKNVLKRAAAELQFVKTTDLSVHRHDGTSTVALASGELRYFMWIEVDGKAYDLQEYQRLNLENGSVVAHSNLEGILEMFSNLVAEPDLEILNYLKGKWQISKFLEAATNSVQPFRGIADSLAKKYPDGADWITTVPLQTSEQARELALKHLVPMPPNSEVDSRVLSAMRSTRLVVQKIQSIIKGLELSNIAISAAVQQAEQLQAEVKNADASIHDMSSISDFLASLVPLLKWMQRYAALKLDNQVNISAEDLQGAIELVSTIPDQQILTTNRGKRLQHIVQANDVVSNWVAPYDTPNGNVDKLVRSELDFMRRLLVQAVPLTAENRSKANRVLLATDLVLQTVNAQPRLRPRISQVRPFAHLSALLADAVAAYDNMQRQYPPIPQLLNDVATTPAMVGQISQMLAPFLGLRVVPDDVERIVSIVSFGQPAPQMWPAPAFGPTQFSPPPGITQTHTVPTPPIPYQGQPQSFVPQAATPAFGGPLPPGTLNQAQFERPMTAPPMTAPPMTAPPVSSPVTSGDGRPMSRATSHVPTTHSSDQGQGFKEEQQ